MRDLLGVRRYPRFGDTILHSSLQSAATLLVHLHAEAGGAVAEGGAPFALAVGGEVELIVISVPAGVEAELQPLGNLLAELLLCSSQQRLGEYAVVVEAQAFDVALSEQLAWLSTWIYSAVAHWPGMDTLHGNECVPVLQRRHGVQT